MNRAESAKTTWDPNLCLPQHTDAKPVLPAKTVGNWGRFQLRLDLLTEPVHL